MKLKTQKDFNLFKEELLIAIRDFLSNKPTSNSLFFKDLEFTYKKLNFILNQRFVKMENFFCFDRKVNACWIGLCGNYNIETFDYDIPLKNVLDKIKTSFKINNLDLPTKQELLNLTNLKNVNFPTINDRPAIGAYILYKYENPKNLKFYVRSLSMSRLPVKSLADIQGVVVPLYRLYNSEVELDNKYIFLLWVIHKLKPFDFKDEFYDLLLQFDLHENDLKIKLPEISSDVIGIDFGTTSTIVTREKTPLSISFDIETGIDINNPTIIEFDNQEPLISHIAYKHYKEFNIDKFFRFVTELKPWMEGKKRRLSIIYQNQEVEIPRYEKTDIDLLELYFFNLAKQINKTTIFTEYVVSIPLVNPKLEAKIINSIKTAIIKAINKNITLKTIYSTTAYLLEALNQYEIKSNNLYGVIDFGGGDVEYEIGLFEYSKEMRYDYIIKRLENNTIGIGNEAILELIAYEIIEINRDLLQQYKMCDYSIQKLNKVIIIDFLKKYQQEQTNKISLFTASKTKAEIEIELPDINDLLKIHYEVIIDNFLKHFNQYHQPKYLFLSGEVTKSPIFKELLTQKISSLNIKLLEALPKETTALGLVKARQGGRFKIENINFKYILGVNKNNKFLPMITEKTPFNKWIKFIDASEEFFEIYYILYPIDKESKIKRKKLEIKTPDKDGFIYIRTIDKTKFEYAVIKDNKLISEIYKVNLKD